MKEGLAYEAGKYFDVYNYTYNVQASAEQKLKVQSELVETVSKYSVKHQFEHGNGEPATFGYLFWWGT